MDIAVAKERLPYVTKTDVITESQGDFMATHVAIKTLQLQNSFELVPSKSKTYTEEELFQKFIKNPQNLHQFIVVYGKSGTGKSHLIRWFEARLEKNKPENEVVLFVRRSDNTLKGTIGQLLEMPEVRNIKNRNVYERLVKASKAVSEEELKDTIYYTFITVINHVGNDQDNEESDYPITFTNVQRKRFIAFLQNDSIHDFMFREDGPIERIYSKVAQNNETDRDLVPEFKKQDFYITSDLYDLMNGADHKAAAVARKLMSDTEGEELAKTYAAFINQFVPIVIQRCTGIEPGDFADVFLEIRKELFKQGKQLTLFIEDITSFTGVDVALLNALITAHTGEYENANICRLSSIVGSTGDFLQKNFRDNHKDRVTQYIYIPDDAFDQLGIEEFVARYLNTMSLDKVTIDNWLDDGADPREYPVHIVKEGKDWEYVTCAGKKLNLYPFTKYAIKNMYRDILKDQQRTPRYIIRDIIEPVVRDAIDNQDSFPSLEVPFINVGSLSYMVHNKLRDEKISDKVIMFLTVWGNGKPESYIKDEITYVSGISEKILKSVNIPILDFQKVEAPKPEDAKISPVSSQYSNQVKEKDTIRKPVNDEKKEKINDVLKVLDEWKKGKSINISTTQGAQGRIREAVRNLISFVKDAISWQVEGVSINNVNKVVDNYRLIMMENQTKGNGLYILKANYESETLLMSFVHWKEFGNSSWNYKDADFDLYFVTSWLARNKTNIVSAVKYYKDKKEVNYIEAAMAAEIYRLILTGEFSNKSLDSFSVKDFYEEKEKISANNGHCKNWNSALNTMTAKEMDKENTFLVRQYYNLTLGGGTRVIVLDLAKFKNMLKNVKSEKLIISEERSQDNDIIPGRKKSYTYLHNIQEKVDGIADAELELAMDIMKPVLKSFEIEDEDDLEDFDTESIVNFADIVKAFYNEINDTQINISIVSTETIKRNASKIVQAIKRIYPVLDGADTLRILTTFSCDPMNDIKPLVELLTTLDNDMKNADKALTLMKKNLGEVFSNQERENRYSSQTKSLESDIDLLSRMRG